jgi:hypothetical protein
MGTSFRSFERAEAPRPEALLVRDQPLDLVLVALVHQLGTAELPLRFRGFLGQDVPPKRRAATDFSRPGLRKAFGRAPLRLELRHFAPKKYEHARRRANDFPVEQDAPT